MRDAWQAMTSDLELFRAIAEADSCSEAGFVAVLWIVWDYCVTEA
jgi:hypothetical protein